MTLFLLAMATAAYAHGSVKLYTASLDTLNDSGVSGTAHLSLDGDQLTVSIEATGFEAGKTHAQHIHGAETNKGNATCPTAAADANGDGIVDIGEGLPFYGPPLLFLEPFSNTPEGTLDYEATFTVDAQELGPLQNRAIVLHGLTIDGVYVGSTPVACGQIRPAPHGGN